MQYYPIFFSLEFKASLSRCLIMLYVVTYIALTVVPEGACIGHLPTSNHVALMSEAELRLVYDVFTYIHKNKYLKISV